MFIQSFEIKEIPVLKLLPCFNVTDFNVGILFKDHDVQIMSEEVPCDRLFYTFQVEMIDIH
jgi:hypothetical protein